MPLDQFKTQILLLHSEQSTLDTLSSGFGDSYTVHCATTGSEALNTLVDTPINVIVTAQNLPGMSGIEALREAKKRSPDTIGILLAGNEDSGLEALVGDKEVFQVVRGTVTSDSISELVDNATQQMRLMALAKSANDAAANVDEPAEHIVMETSENGSTIISDGTGRMPALDPTKVSAASAVGSHSIDLLVLTKDTEFLQTIKESSRGTHEVHYANTLSQADQIIRKHKVGVAVVDAAMVGEKIEQLTAHLRKGSPRLVSIVAGRRDDGEMMMDLINRSKVYRFLLKPVSPGRARLAVEASVKHHLEAPDAAFKTKDSTLPPTPALKPATRPAAKPRPAPKSTPAAKAKPEPKSAKDKKTSTSKAPYADDPPIGSSNLAAGQSPNDDALSGAFGGGDSSFTETVTGLFATVSKKFSAIQAADATPEKFSFEQESPSAIGEPSAIDEPSAIGEPSAIDEPSAIGEPSAIDDTSAIGPDASAPSSGGSLPMDPKLLGIGTAAIVVVAGALFWLMSGSDDAGESAAPVVETPIAETTITETPDATDTEIVSDAETGVGEQSVDGEALDVATQIDRAISDAENALLESRIDDASAALELLGRTDPENERLPFLTAQLAQIQLRTHLIEARAAIRDERFEDAASALAAARSLNLPDSTEVDTAELELIAAQDAQQAEEVLALANARLEDGELLEPPNDNARYFFELALSRDPENPAARQGLSAIASKLAMQARDATDDGDLDGAEALLVESNALDSDNSELQAAIEALADKRAAVAAERRRAEAEKRAADARAAAEREAEQQRAAAEREAEQQRAAAERAAEQQRAAAAAAAPAKEAAALPEEQSAATSSETVADSGAVDAATSSQTAVDNGAAVAATSSETAADSGAVDAAAGSQTALDNGAVDAATDSQTVLDDGAVDAAATNVVEVSRAAVGQPAKRQNVDTPVADKPAVPVGPTPATVRDLNRTRYVAPKYPRVAQRRNLSGWVDVIFTVDSAGLVKDVSVRDSKPGETFVASAVRAVEKWEFEPVVENGQAVEKRVGVRMLFALE